MKKKHLIAVFIAFVFIACSNEEQKEVNSEVDDKEYIGDKNKDKKKSDQEVEGYFLFAMGNDGGKKESFDREYSDITIKKDQLLIRLKSSDGVVILITLNGPEVDHNPVRKYIPFDDPNLQSPFKATLAIMGVYDGDKKNPNILKRGEMRIRNIDFKNGAIQGEYVQLGGRMEEPDESKLIDFHGDFDLRNLVVQENR